MGQVEPLILLECSGMKEYPSRTTISKKRTEKTILLKERSLPLSIRLLAIVEKEFATDRKKNFQLERSNVLVYAVPFQQWIRIPHRNSSYCHETKFYAGGITGVCILALETIKDGHLPDWLLATVFYRTRR